MRRIVSQGNHCGYDALQGAVQKTKIPKAQIILKKIFAIMGLQSKGLRAMVSIKTLEISFFLTTINPYLRNTYQVRNANFFCY